METFLKNDFTKHYGLLQTTIVNFSATTNVIYFELKDDSTVIHLIINDGIAKYSNTNLKVITVINYELFFNSLSKAFIQGKEKCDLILFDNNQDNFILNELSDTLPKYVFPYVNTQGIQPGKRQKAISQLVNSVALLMNVSSIALFARKHTNKRCCFFNKQSVAPSTITATSAFGRFNKLIKNGLKMSNPDIEAFGFEFWEYSGDQVYQL